MSKLEYPEPGMTMPQTCRRTWLGVVRVSAARPCTVAGATGCCAYFAEPTLAFVDFGDNDTAVVEYDLKLADLRKSDLVEICKWQGASSAGTKAELLARVRAPIPAADTG